MKELLKYAFILMMVTLTASGALSLVNQITTPKIEAQKQQELLNGLAYVLPEASEGVIISITQKEMQYFEGYSNKDTTHMIGIAFSSYAKGYSSTIWTLVGLDTVGNIVRINVLDQKETPGLGTRCMEIKPGETEPWWQFQFQGKKAAKMAVDKDGGKIVSITGATITSRAITNGIALQSKTLLDQITGTQE